ncbi:Bro-N domain-containing protein [Candidatus Igneacidithiobacillus taiwanensis]|uniref:BRO-N domain-containing protein n=1 Tax=Candidatus Igneacidithiobacillus taiwanensis TaxID=1945924 RepID=UPI0028A1588F|nr:Bro-N domain-containing protein [Candidatus Igneacidithiobacillus taiwanensis]
MITPIPQGVAAPTVFRFHSIEVHTLDRDGQVWFVAGDVARVFGFADATHIVRWLDEDEAALHTLETLSTSADGRGGGEQQVTIISESGLYHALLKSRKPEAKPFRRWVTLEVLSAIRQHGGYGSPKPIASGILTLPPGMKLLLTFEEDGRYRAEPVLDDAMVVTTRQIAEIVEAHGYILGKPFHKEDKL